MSTDTLISAWGQPVIISNSTNSSSNSTDYYYIEAYDENQTYLWNPNTTWDCWAGVGVNAIFRNQVYYGFDGLPIPSTINHDILWTVISSMLSLGGFGAALNIICALSVYRNPYISKAVKCYLLVDTYCRLNESWVEFYKAHCLLKWQCVQKDPYPFAGIFFNSIITSFTYGMSYSMQMLSHGLCFNRVFAVFFHGRHYRQIERWAYPHAFLLWFSPILFFLLQTGYFDEKTGFRCFCGFFFSPLEFFYVAIFNRGPIFDILNSYFDYFMYGVLAITMLLDFLTLWKIRTLVKLSESKRRADVRLSIMLVITHCITICFHVWTYLVNNVMVGVLPIFYFLGSDLGPFCFHTILGSVVIYFNWASRRKRDRSKMIPEMFNLSRGTPLPTKGIADEVVSKVD